MCAPWDLVRATHALTPVLPPTTGSPRVETALVVGEPFVEIARSTGKVCST